MGVGGKSMIGVRSDQLLAIIDSVFDVRYVGKAVDGGRMKCVRVLSQCRFRNWLDRQFGERSGQVTEGWKPAKFGSTEFPFRCDTCAIEAFSLQERVNVDEEIMFRIIKRQPIKRSTTEVDRLL